MLSYRHVADATARTCIALAVALICGVLMPACSGQQLKVCMISGSFEYESHKSLAAYGKHIEKNYNVDCTLLKATSFGNLPGLEALGGCDVALIFTRRFS